MFENRSETKNALITAIIKSKTSNLKKKCSKINRERKEKSKIK